MSDRRQSNNNQPWKKNSRYGASTSQNAAHTHTQMETQAEAEQREYNEWAKAEVQAIDKDLRKNSGYWYLLEKQKERDDYY